MPLVPFQRLMEDAERGRYAVGYFESWNLESLQGVLDAAAATSSPVIVGFSGLNLPDPRRRAAERLAVYAAMARAACESSPVPAALLFNESPHMKWICEAIGLGFNMVMFADETLSLEEVKARVRETVVAAADRAAVEAELNALPGLSGGLAETPAHVPLTDPAQAAAFVRDTGIDALAVALGQFHVHGRHKVDLDLDRLRAIRQRVSVPLVLHGATSIADDALRRAIEGGIRKINVGSALRSAFFNAVRQRVQSQTDDFNPYHVLGSGLAEDILLAGRLAVRDRVAERMHLFGSAGRATVGA